MPDGFDGAVGAAVRQLCAQAERRFGEGLYASALDRWKAAWEIVPAPRERWPEAAEILISIGDCCLQLDQDQAAYQAYSLALTVPGQGDQPLLRLRLGAVCHALGKRVQAGEGFALLESRGTRWPAPR